MPPGWWMIAEHPVRESVHSGRRARGPAKPQGLRERCTLSRTTSEHLVKLRKWPQMRCRPPRKIEHHFIDVTPAPPFRRIIGLDDRVPGRVKMFCCVPIWRLIAATDMATGAADPQMQPGVTRFQAFLTPRRARNDVADC